jgi:alpha-D-ribose 1-methylphosphonate 5-triphosphate synthase subunit PhnH
LTVTDLPAAASQQVFRAVLTALSRPGEIGRISVPGYESVPAALVPVLALADLATPVHVLSDDPQWSVLVSATTGAPVAAAPDARLVAALDPPQPAWLRTLSRGSAAEPERAAQLFLGVSDLADSGGLRLSGPGVPGVRRLYVAGVPGGFWTTRGEVVADFPAGVDLVLLTPDGRLAAVPRSTTVTEEMR